MVFGLAVALRGDVPVLVANLLPAVGERRLPESRLNLRTKALRPRKGAAVQR